MTMQSLAHEMPTPPVADEPPMRVQDASILLLDLGVGAVMVETDGWLAPQHRYPVRLGPDIRLIGQVTRCAPMRVEPRDGGERAIHRAILRFDSPSPIARQQIGALAQQLGSLGPADPLPAGLSIG